MFMTMKRYFLLGSLLVLTSTHLFSQARNATVKDPKLNNQEVAIGYWDTEGIRTGIFGLYFGSQYELYQPVEKYIEKMKGSINNVDITIVFGSWCGDSQIQVGRFFKVLDEAGFNAMHLKIIGVNRDKNALSVNVEPLDIERIPTFIVFQGGKELGRIVESPKKSLEKDLSKIISKAR
jgi:thiol-disulfide isomerase/thioredoxin